MHVYQISDFLEKLAMWHSSDCTLGALEHLLGIKHSQLFNFFYENHICNIQGKPTREEDLQHTINCLLLYLALKRSRI